MAQGADEVITNDRSPDEDLNPGSGAAAPADDVEEEPRIEFTDGLAAIVRRPGVGQY